MCVYWTVKTLMRAVGARPGRCCASPTCRPATKLTFDVVPDAGAPVGSARRNPAPPASVARDVDDQRGDPAGRHGMPAGSVDPTVSPAAGLCAVEPGGTGPAASRACVERSGVDDGTKRPAADRGRRSGVKEPRRSTTTLPPVGIQRDRALTPRGTIAKLGWICAGAATFRSRTHRAPPAWAAPARRTGSTRRSR